MSSLGRALFHQLTVKDYVFDPTAVRRSDEYDDTSTARFLARFDGHLRFDRRTVLEIGCGSGVLCAAAVRLGAERVVGIDLDVGPTVANLRERFPEVAGQIGLVATTGDMAELAGEQFDLVISKNAMEHFDDPEAFAHLMVEHVRPGGELAIGFGPLWKSPFGGHIDFMTKVPWAHLIFSEPTIMAERARFRPDENATRWSEIKGGLNQMTYARFLRIMGSTALEPVYLATNVSDSRVVRLLKLASRSPLLRELATVNVYGVWRRPGS